MSYRAIKLAVMPAFCLMSVLSQASSFDVTGRIDQQVEFDDNFLLQEDKQETWIYYLSPSVSLNTVEKAGSTTLTADFDIRRHSQFKNSDSENANLQFSKHWQKPKSSYSLAMGYRIRDQRDDAEEDLGQFDSTNRVETFSFAPATTYQLSELDRLGINLSVTNKQYSAATTDDSDNYSLGASWSRQLDRLQSISTNIRYSEFKTEGVIEDSKNKNSSVSISYSFEPSEKLMIVTDLGYNKSDSHQFDDQSLVFIDRSSTGGLFSLRLQRDTERGSNTVSVSRDYSSASSGEVVRRDKIGYNWSYKYSPKSVLSLGFNWIRSKEQGGEREFYTLTPGYGYDLSEDLSVKLTYDYRSQRRDGEESVDSNALILKLSHKF